MNSLSAADRRALILGIPVGIVLAWLLWTLRNIVVLVAFSVLLAFVLDPLVSRLQRVPLPRGRRVPRPWAAAFVVLGILVLGGWLLGLLFPRLVTEVGRFVGNLPQNVTGLLESVRGWATGRGMSRWSDPMLDQAQASAMGALQNLGGMIAGWAGRALSGIVQILGLFVLPLLTFYLLAESEAVRQGILGFLPLGAKPWVERVRRASDRALRSYVRGQAIVCVIMGTATGLMLAMIGIPFALLLGVVAGLAEVVPWLGAIIAALAIAIAGFGQGLDRVLLGVGLYIALNQLNSLVVTPRVMGRHLELHPFIVTVSVLAGAELLGPAGALLALPGTAVIQALISEVAPRRTERAREAREDVKEERR